MKNQRRSSLAPIFISAVLLFNIHSTNNVNARSLVLNDNDEAAQLAGDYPLLDALDKLEEETSTPNLRHGRRLQQFNFPFNPPAAAPLPPMLPHAIGVNLAIVTDPIAEQDTAFFWHIPKAGGSTMKAYYGRCLHKVEATEGGRLAGPDQDKELKIFTRGDYRFVNVDTSSPQGIQHAKEMQLAESGLADVIVSSYLHGAADLFNPVNRGRFFTIFRHPIERAASLFYYRQTADWEKSYGDGLKTITFEQFLRKGRGEKNWMVRVLVNKFTEPLSGEDLQMAKEIIRTRCVVGMMDRMKESLDRFDMYFGWKTDEGEQCKNELLNHGVNSNPHAKIEVGSEVWNMLYEQNELDIKLYEYAQVLFEEQRELFNAQNVQR